MGDSSEARHGQYRLEGLSPAERGTAPRSRERPLRNGNLPFMPRGGELHPAGFEESWWGRGREPSTRNDRRDSLQRFGSAR